MKNARRVTIFATFEQLVNILFWEVRLSSGEGVLKNDSLESLNRRFYHSPDHFLKAVIVWPWDGMNILMVIIRANDILEIGWLMKTTAVTKYFSNVMYRPHVNEKKTTFIIHATAFTSTSSKHHYRAVWCALCSACSLDTWYISIISPSVESLPCWMIQTYILPYLFILCMLPFHSIQNSVIFCSFIT